MPTPPAVRFLVRRAPILLLALTLSAGLAARAAANDRPSVQFTRAPAPLAAVYWAQQFGWLGSDPDGSVASYRWAIDPSPTDTFWVDTPDTSRFLLFIANIPETPFAAPGLPEFCSAAHTVVVKAVDDLGLESPAVARSFIARDQAPSAVISSPAPSPSIIGVPSTILIDWSGNDPDGLFSTQPIQYKFQIASLFMIQAALGMSTNPTEAQLQQYFSLEAPNFASWTSASRDSSHARFTNLILNQLYYFAVIAIDETYGWDPRFLRSTNVLGMQVTSVSGVPGAGGMELAFAPPSPNPAQSGVSFDFTLPRPGETRLDIFDAAGRHVRTLAAGRREAGPHSLAWNLVDDTGALVRPGAYLARFSLDGEPRIRRFVVLR